MSAKKPCPTCGKREHAKPCPPHTPLVCPCGGSVVLGVLREKVSTATLADMDPRGLEQMRLCRVRDGIEEALPEDRARVEALGAARCGWCMEQPCKCFFRCGCGWSGRVLNCHREGGKLDGFYCTSRDVHQVCHLPPMFPRSPAPDPAAPTYTCTACGRVVHSLFELEAKT